MSWLFVDVCVLHGPLARSMKRVLLSQHGSEPVAEVYGMQVTRRDLGDALRESLWESGGSWQDLNETARRQLRRQILERLIDDRLIRHSRIQDGLEHPPRFMVAQKEAALHRQQFADVAELPLRLAAQQQTRHEFVAGIHETQLDEAWLREQTAKRAAKVTDTELRAWYAHHHEVLRIPEAYHVAHLFLTRHDPAKPDRQAEMRAIHQQLMSKEQTFAALVAKYSEDERTRKIGGDLGWFTEARMPDDFMAAVRSLRVGAWSAPVATRLGWHLLVVLERRSAQTPAYEEVRNEIEAKLESQRRETAVRDLLMALRERAQQSAGAWIYHSRVVDLVEPTP